MEGSNQPRGGLAVESAPQTDISYRSAILELRPIHTVKSGLQEDLLAVTMQQLDLSKTLIAVVVYNDHMAYIMS